MLICRLQICTPKWARMMLITNSNDCHHTRQQDKFIWPFKSLPQSSVEWMRPETIAIGFFLLFWNNFYLLWCTHSLAKCPQSFQNKYHGKKFTIYASKSKILCNLGVSSFIMTGLQMIPVNTASIVCAPRPSLSVFTSLFAHLTCAHTYTYLPLPSVERCHLFSGLLQCDDLFLLTCLHLSPLTKSLS